MSSPTTSLIDSIDRCKATLPLPALWKKLQLRGEPKRSCHSPFREDNNRSFSVFQSGKRWFWRDQAWNKSGDEIDLIVMAKGIEKKEAIKLYHEMAGVSLFKALPLKGTKQPSNGLGKLIATYDYLNAEGKLLHQTLRFEPKTFRQRRPAVEGMRQSDRQARKDPVTGKWWIWTLEGIEPVLYRLPQLLAAPSHPPVVLCEGEKDADALAQAEGAVTTTAPMGACKWRKSYTETLKGRDVIIWPDRDPKSSTQAGQRHAERVAEELKNGGASRVRIVDWHKAWPEGASDEECKLDVSDFIEETARNDQPA